MSASQAREKLALLHGNIEKIVRGKSDIVQASIVGLLAHGHILYEDVPGVGKTTIAHCLALSLGLSFQRIQFTSDLLPSDILGVVVYNPEKRDFEFRAGPIFANVVLVDEINRTTPKTQSALLEAMNSARVSIDKTTYDLPTPFIVIATQNPVESHGTFALPQSQLDRFLMRLHLGYPAPEFEREILENGRLPGDLSVIDSVLTRDDVVAMQEGAAAVKVEASLIDYLVRLAQTSRTSGLFHTGISPRGAIALRRAAQAQAYYEGRDYCIPDDIKAMAVSVLAHRIIPAHAYEEESAGVGHGSDHILRLLEEVEVPV